MEKKAQSAIEFVILVGFALFFFVSFIFLLQLNINQKNFEKTDIAVREVALTVQDEIALASSTSDGYSRSFTLPNLLLGHNYTAEITQSLDVYVITDDEKHAIALNVFNVTGQPRQGANFIRKELGVVYLN